MNDAHWTEFDYCAICGAVLTEKIPYRIEIDGRWVNTEVCRPCWEEAKEDE